MANKSAHGKVIFSVIAALGAIAAVFPLAIYYLVETAGSHSMHGMPMAMACEKACIAATMIGAVITVIAIAALFVQNAFLSIGMSVTLLIGGVAAIAVPRFIGFCTSADMACRYLTVPTLGILGGAIIVLSVVKLAKGTWTLRRSAAL
ncbi:MAG: DUF4418 family protein [Peptococcaceae bacterium]|jgi:hypothetical protein|nr:DUF4418 family protein [Peptococcaceae bacterium]